MFQFLHPLFMALKSYSSFNIKMCMYLNETYCICRFKLYTFFICIHEINIFGNKVASSI